MAYISKRKISTRSDKHIKRPKNSNPWSHYYQNRAYKKLREWQITNHPICHDCAIEGRSVPAEHVHHIIPFSRGETEEEKFRLLLDPSNLVSLCAECHQKRHNELNNEDK